MIGRPPIQPMPGPTPWVHRPRDSFVIEHYGLPPGEQTDITIEPSHSSWVGDAMGFGATEMVFVGSAGLWLTCDIGDVLQNPGRLPLDSFRPGCPHEVNWALWGRRRHPLRLRVDNRLNSEPANLLIRFAGYFAFEPDWRPQP